MPRIEGRRLTIIRWKEIEILADLGGGLVCNDEEERCDVFEEAMAGSTQINFNVCTS